MKQKRIRGGIMLKNKKYGKLMVVLFLCLALMLSFGCSNNQKTGTGGDANGAQQQAIQLSWAHTQNDTHPYSIAGEYFAKKIKERTDGRITCKIFPAGMLGPETDAVNSLKLGDIDISPLQVGNLSPFVPELNLLGIHYMFKDYETFTKVIDMNSPFVAWIDKIMIERNVQVRIGGMIAGSARNTFSRSKPIVEPSDLKGVKMRVMSGPIEAKVWGEALGTITQSVPIGETYSALQTGVVDAAEGTALVYSQFKLNEVAPYYSLTQHQYGCMPILISGKTLDEKIPAEFRDIVMETLKEAGKVGSEAYIKDDDEALRVFVEAGKTTVNETNLDAFIDIVQPMHEEFAKEYGAEEGLRLIREMSK